MQLHSIPNALHYMFIHLLINVLSLAFNGLQELLPVVTQEYGNVNTENDLYWTPGSTVMEIRTQMSQKAQHSFGLQPESITFLEELGEGEFGMVYKGEWVDSPQGPLQVAVKSLHRQEEENRYKLLKEAAIMGQFNHPYVVRLYGVVDQPEKVSELTCLHVSHAI